MDFTNVEKIGPDYWRNSQLSVARFGGGCILQGVHYILCPVTDYLIREDIWKMELKEAKKQRAIAKAEKAKWESIQINDLFKEVTK